MYDIVLRPLPGSPFGWSAIPFDPAGLYPRSVDRVADVSNVPSAFSRARTVAGTDGTDVIAGAVVAA